MHKEDKPTSDGGGEKISGIQGDTKVDQGAGSMGKLPPTKMYAQECFD